jgi:hypothetical protein
VENNNGVVPVTGEITRQVNCCCRCTVACQLGGAGMRTLFCLRFDGTFKGVGKGGTRSQIETVVVESAGLDPLSLKSSADSS